MQGQDGFIPSSNREEALSVLCFYMNILESELPMLTWEYVRIFANVAHWDNFKFCRFFFKFWHSLVEEIYAWESYLKRGEGTLGAGASVLKDSTAP